MKKVSIIITPNVRRIDTINANIWYLERTVEAVHEKGYTDVEAAAEYLLTTGNLEGFSVEKMAPKEHKYESKEFCPNHQFQFSKTISREANLLKSRYIYVVFEL